MDYHAMAALARRVCSCGSGRVSYEQRDARGIYLCRTCSDCHIERMARFRPEVLRDPQYAADDLGDDEALD